MLRINLFKQCRKIIGIGMNYPPAVAPTEPVLFLKSPSSMIAEGKPIIIPKRCTDVHHEVELGVVIGQPGSNINTHDAMKHVAGYTLALDMTAACQLSDVRANRLSWALAKCFDTFCPINDVIQPDKIPNPDNIELWLKINGELRQSGNTNEMAFSVPQLISFCSQIMTLEEGDVILTGSPRGVGPVRSGDIIECGIDGVKEMKVEVQKPWPTVFLGGRAV